MKIIKVSLPSGSKMKQATQDGDTLVVEFEERFEPKDGDIVYNDMAESTSIFKSQTEKGSTIYAGITYNGDIFIDERGWSFPTRLANQKETFTFFDALKGKGVRWNPEEKKIEIEMESETGRIILDSARQRQY